MPAGTRRIATTGFYGILVPFVINKLFVYGTLKIETHLLNEMVGSSGYRFLGKATISGKKLSGTPYPAVVKTNSGERVYGELIQLTPFKAAIHLLDEYEGFDPNDPKGSLYIRERVHVDLDDGLTADAWV